MSIETLVIIIVLLVLFGGGAVIGIRDAGKTKKLRTRTFFILTQRVTACASDSDSANHLMRSKLAGRIGNAKSRHSMSRMRWFVRRIIELTKRSNQR